MFHNSGRWFLGSQRWNSSRNENTRSLARDFSSSRRPPPKAASNLYLSRAGTLGCSPPCEPSCCKCSTTPAAGSWDPSGGTRRGTRTRVPWRATSLRRADRPRRRHRTCTYREREHSDALPLVNLRVVNVPQLRPLVLGIPAVELVAEREHAFLGARLLFVAPTAPEGGIELVLIESGNTRMLSPL